MATSKDFKALFDRFQEEGAPHGVSIIKYCQMNGVVYSLFASWYKKHASALSSLKACKLPDLETLASLFRELDNGNTDYDDLVSRTFIPQFA